MTSCTINEEDDWIGIELGARGCAANGRRTVSSESWEGRGSFHGFSICCYMELSSPYVKFASLLSKYLQRNEQLQKPLILAKHQENKQC